MLLKPHLWLQGLIPVALVAGGSLWWKQADIERELGERTSQAIAAASPTVDGKPWAIVTVFGRDVTIAGAAPAETELSRSEVLAESLSGVRLARIPAGLLPDANPFGWSAERDGSKISLSGFVAPDGARARIIEAARQAASGGEVVDRMISARNVPATATETALVAIAQLARLTTGSVSLAGSTLRISGGAVDAATQSAIAAAIANLPQGASASRIDLQTPELPATAPGAAQAPGPAAAAQSTAPSSQTAAAPTAAPLPATPWTAIKSGSGIVLGGSVASEEARRRILAAARAATAGRITDGMIVAADLAPAIETQAIAVLRQLADLTSAQASITDRAVSLQGQAADPDGYARLSVTPLRPIDGFTLGAVEITPPRVELFSWRARKRDNVLTLDGLAPSSNERIAVLTEAASGGLRIVDDMRVATGLWPGVDYGQVTSKLLGALGRLSDGSVEINGSRVIVTGRAPNAATAEAVRAALATIGGPLTVTADIGLVPEPPAAPPAAPVASAAAQPDASGAIASAAGSAAASAAPSAPTVSAVSVPPPVPPTPQIICGPRIAAALSNDRLLFDYWKSDPKTDWAPALDRLATAMRGCNPPTRIEVSGHADIRNVSNSNQILSELRARAVRDELIRRGVDPTILIAVGYAATRPIAPNDTEENMALNRRVDIIDLTNR